MTRKWHIVLTLAPMLVLICSGGALAQLNGVNIRGDVGLAAGSQPPPGIYLTNLNYFYSADQIKGREGRTLNLTGDLLIYMNATAFTWVPKTKVLGGNYNFTAVLPFMNNNPEVPKLNVNESAFALSDIYIQPLGLGWHKKQADFNAGYAIVLPTGRYEPNGTNNTGFGMVGHEFTAGFTAYFDQEHKWNVSTAGAYDIHQNKRDVDVRVGDMLTLEGGAGRSWMKGGVNAGLVYYAQWKVTNDSGSDLPRMLQLAGLENAKNKAYGLGPEFRLVIPKIEGQLTFRYYKEFGNRSTTEGHTFVGAITFFLHRPFAQMRRQQPVPAGRKP